MKNKTIIIVLIGLLIVGMSSQVLGYEGYQIINHKEVSKADNILSSVSNETETKFDLSVDSNAVKIADKESEESIIIRLNQQVKDSMITTSLITQPIFTDGNSTGVIKIKNVESNKHPLKVEIVLKDKNEVIYTSPILNVGQGLEEIKLSDSLSKGVYPCTAYFMNIQEGKVVGKAGVDISVNVKN